MLNFMNLKSAAWAGAIAAAALAVSVPEASALPGNSLHAAATSGGSTIVKVHSRRAHQGHHRHHHHRHIVDAPFTRVETGRRVIVDAPFAHVSVNRRGRHVVAPFVNLWLPR